MPGPVSDSYDPEFSTSQNRYDVIDAMKFVRQTISNLLGDELKNIVSVVHGEEGKRFYLHLCEQDLRVIRYAINTAIEQVGGEG